MGMKLSIIILEKTFQKCSPNSEKNIKILQKTCNQKLPKYGQIFNILYELKIFCLMSEFMSDV